MVGLPDVASRSGQFFPLSELNVADPPVASVLVVASVVVVSVVASVVASPVVSVVVAASPEVSVELLTASTALLTVSTILSVTPVSVVVSPDDVDAQAPSQSIAT